MKQLNITAQYKLILNEYMNFIFKLSFIFLCKAQNGIEYFFPLCLCLLFVFIAKRKKFVFILKNDKDMKWIANISVRSTISRAYNDDKNENWKHEKDIGRYQNAKISQLFCCLIFFCHFPSSKKFSVWSIKQTWKMAISIKILDKSLGLWYQFHITF